jgi:hypothetical protein
MTRPKAQPQLAGIDDPIHPQSAISRTERKKSRHFCVATDNRRAVYKCGFYENKLLLTLAHLIRGAVYLLLLIAMCVIPFAGPAAASDPWAENLTSQSASLIREPLRTFTGVTYLAPQSRERPDQSHRSTP